jgi:hypothetical protein
MHVIWHATNGQSFYVVFSRDAAEVRLESFVDGRREQRTPFLGGEHAMHQAGVE